MTYTEEQKKSLERVFQRTIENENLTEKEVHIKRVEFLGKVENCGEYIMVPFCGMWLGIEKDGYTHS
jgi:hypothetical protein